MGMSIKEYMESGHVGKEGAVSHSSVKNRNLVLLSCECIRRAGREGQGISVRFLLMLKAFKKKDNQKRKA